MSASKKELKPGLYEFVKTHYLENEDNQKGFRLKRFWNSTKFEQTDGAKAFIKTMKENWDNSSWDKNKWKRFGLTPLREIKDVVLELHKEKIELEAGQVLDLCNGYRWALMEIVIKGYPPELSAIIESTKESKKKKDKEANAAAQQKLRDFSKAMKQIKEYILADYSDADLEKSAEEEGSDQSESESRDGEKPAIKKDNLQEATLEAIASGSKAKIQGVIATYYTEVENEEEKGDDKPLLDLPKDKWEARKETLESFQQKKTKNADNMYLFKNNEENDPKAIKQALYGLFNYIDQISDQDKTITFGKSTSLKIGQKGGADKKDSLKAFIAEVSQADSLEAMEKMIHDELKTDRKTKGGLLENRGLIGGYWVGSLFARKFNPVDGKCINSTTESYLVSLYDKVREQRKLEDELVDQGNDIFVNHDKSYG